MQTIQERKAYWGNNFMELEVNAIQHILNQVEAIETDREHYTKQDMIKLRMISKWKQDIEKLYQYFIDNEIVE